MKIFTWRAAQHLWLPWALQSPHLWREHTALPWYQWWSCHSDGHLRCHAQLAAGWGAGQWPLLSGCGGGRDEEEEWRPAAERQIISMRVRIVTGCCVCSALWTKWQQLSCILPENWDGFRNDLWAWWARVTMIRALSISLVDKCTR